MKRKREDQEESNTNDDGDSSTKQKALRIIFDSIRRQPKRKKLRSFSTFMSSQSQVMNPIELINSIPATLPVGVANRDLLEMIDVNNTFEAISLLSSADQDVSYISNQLALKVFEIQQSDKHQLKQSIQNLCSVLKHFMTRNEFDRGIFAATLFNSSHAEQSLNLTVVDVLDSNMIITYEQFISHVCNDRYNSVLFVSHLARHMNQSKRSVKKILELVQSGSQKYSAAINHFLSALRKWKNFGYFLDNSAVCQLYIKLLTEAVSQPDFISKELVLLFTPDDHTRSNNFSQVYELVDDDAFSFETSEFSQDVVSMLSSVFVHISQLLNMQQTKKFIDQCVRSSNCDWKFLFAFCMHMCRTSREMTQFNQDAIADAINNEDLNLFIVHFLLARHIYNTKNSNNLLIKSVTQPITYEQWIKNNIIRVFKRDVNNPISPKILKKNRDFVVSALQVLIQYDTPVYLKLMISLVEAYTLDCNEYINQAKNRLTEQGLSTDKFSRIKPSSSLNKLPAYGDISSHEEVKKSLDDFETLKMQRLPGNITNKMFLQRIWYTKQFLPALLQFEEQGSDKAKYKRLLKYMVKFMIEKKNIDASIQQEYSKRIQEIQNYEEEFQEDMNDDEDDVIVYYNEAKQIVNEVTDQNNSDAKRFSSLMNELVAETERSCGVERWIVCCENASAHISRLPEQITASDTQYYTDTILTTFFLASNQVKHHTECTLDEIAQLCDLFTKHILFPMKQIHAKLEGQLLKILYHSATDQSLYSALGLLIGSMCQLKYYSPDTVCLSTIAFSILDLFYPHDIPKYLHFAIPLLTIAFKKHSISPLKSVHDASIRKAQIYIPLALIHKCTWAVERYQSIAFQNSVTGEKDLIVSFLDSYSIKQFAESSSISISDWIRCELFVNQETNDEIALYEMFRNKLFGRYYQSFNESISDLIQAVVENMLEAYVLLLRYTPNVVHKQAERILVAICQEISVEDSGVVPFFDLLLQQLGSLSCQNQRFKLIERFSSILNKMETNYCFRSILGLPNQLTQLINSLNYCYPWPKDFIFLMIKGILVTNEFSIILSEKLPLLMTSIMKLWHESYKSYILTLLYKSKHMKDQVHEAIINPMNNLCNFYESLFKSYLRINTQQLIEVCQSSPRLFAVSFAEYCLSIISYGFGKGQGISLTRSTASSFSSTLLAEYQNIPISTIFRTVIQKLGAARMKDNPQIDLFFSHLMFVLVESFVIQTVFRMKETITAAAFAPSFDGTIMDEMKSFASLCLRMYPQLIFIFSNIMDELDSNEWPILFQDVPVGLLRIDHDKKDFLQLGIASTFFLFVTKLPNDWIDQFFNSETTIEKEMLVILFRKMDALIRTDYGESTVMSRLSTIHKGLIADYLDALSDEARQALLCRD